MIVQYFNWIGAMVTKGDFGYSMYYNRPVAEIVASGFRALAPRARVHTSSLPCLASPLEFWPPPSSTAGWIRCFRAWPFGMTVPRFLMALIMVYLLVFQLQHERYREFLLDRYGGAPWSWDKFVDLVKTRLAGGRHRNFRRARLQHACHARQPAGHAECPVYRNGSCQGLARGRRHHASRGPERAASAHHVSGRCPALHAHGEIEVAIIFALPTVGLRSSGSMQVGDVYVTATFMLVLAATLIIGNIIADMLLAALDPRVRLGGAN